jgi:hypothetical protein
MKTFTIYRSFLCLLILSFLSLPEAKAQLIEEGVCFYENDCVFVEFVAVQEESPTSTELVIVLNAILNEDDNCNDIDGLAFLPFGSIDPVFRSRAQLAANPFVELTVNRALFTTTPDVIVSTYRSIMIPFLGEFRFPTEVVDLQARLDSEDPCLTITPLPVELVAFEGAATESSIALEWRTASEQDNKQFEVEHSADGQAFSQIGIVEGHGNSSAPISYKYIHQSPASGTNYYRLKQVDFSGAFEYSKVIAVTYAGSASLNMQIVVFPNPCQNGDCQIRVNNPNSHSETLLELKDISGRVVLRKTIQNEGKQDMALTLQELGSYRGLYILTATTGTDVVHQRVVLE